MTSADRLAVIHAYITKERKRRQIAPSLKPPQEPSCEMSGEFYNLVEVQLMYTLEGHGAWRDLQYAEILEGAYDYVVYGKRG